MPNSDRWTHNRADALAAGIDPQVIEDYIEWRKAKKRLADMPEPLQACHAAIQATPYHQARREWKASRNAR